jgi:hypothetical protein
MRGKIPRGLWGWWHKFIRNQKSWQPLKNKETEESSYFFYISKEELAGSLDSLISISVYQEKHQSNHKDELVDYGLMCT